MSNQHDPPAIPTLLLATDDLMAQSRIQEAARPMGYTVRTVGSADAVFAALVPVPPVAILVNLSARRFDPFALIEKLKAEDGSRIIPLLAFAGHVEVEKHSRAREAGADMVAANSSVALHLAKLLPRLLAGGTRDEINEEADAA